ncbi:MAG TPA: hypothetical protein VNL70_01635 [Tepidisphaeraceae bacterium]|nr:hypothetical protein [Tepidisphaeraceae bacterium]
MSAEDMAAKVQRAEPQMLARQLQELCDLGHSQLARTEYLRAERTLMQAESLALSLGDFDTLARLYMPLQEARRQRRQYCGEGVVCLDLIAAGPDDRVDGRRVVENYPHGQLLVAGWASIQPALEVRRLQLEHELYVETFLAASYPLGDERVVVIVPLEDLPLPPAEPRRTADELLKLLSPHCILLRESQLPQGVRRGDAHSFSQVMSLWERLHAPFLAAADATDDPLKRIQAYRRTIQVDYACELAHQKLSDTARALARSKRA